MRLVMVVISDRSGNDTSSASTIVDERERVLLFIGLCIFMAQAVCGCEVFFSLYMNSELGKHGRYGKATNSKSEGRGERGKRLDVLCGTLRQESG